MYQFYSQSVYSTWLKWKLLATSRAPEIAVVRKTTSWISLYLLLTSIASRGRVKCCLKLTHFWGVSTLMKLSTANFFTFFVLSLLFLSFWYHATSINHLMPHCCFVLSLLITVFKSARQAWTTQAEPRMCLLPICMPKLESSLIWPSLFSPVYIPWKGKLVPDQSIRAELAYNFPWGHCQAFKLFCSTSNSWARHDFYLYLEIPWEFVFHDLHQLSLGSM